MKGMVFTELLEMVESRFGLDMVDQILDDAETSCDGAYTAVGIYDYKELLSLVGALSDATGLQAGDLTRTFGEHVFGRFVKLYPSFFQEVDSAFDFLSKVEDYIHPEVLKLYPDAELPHFAHSVDATGMTLNYRSPRPLEDFCEGLIAGCVQHFGEGIEVERVDDGADSETRMGFRLTRK